MNLNQLAYLLDIAKTGSMNTTASKMFISQQALSDSIKKLEAELNCTILNRSKTGVTFTEDGLLVLQHASRVEASLNELLYQLQLNQCKVPLEGSLLIGTASFTTNGFFDDLIFEMYHRYPRVAFYTQEYSRKTLISLLQDEQLDFGLCIYLSKNIALLEPLQDQLYFQELYRDQLVCVMSRNNPLSANSDFQLVQVQQLMKQTAYDHIDASPEGVDYIHVSNRASIHQRFMKQKGSVCCMPYQTFISDYPQKDFIYRPIPDAGLAITYLVWNREKYLQQDALYQTFIDLAQAFHSYK